MRAWRDLGKAVVAVLADVMPTFKVALTPIVGLVGGVAVVSAVIAFAAK